MTKFESEYYTLINGFFRNKLKEARQKQYSVTVPAAAASDKINEAAGKGAKVLSVTPYTEAYQEGRCNTVSQSAILVFDRKFE